MRVPFYLIVNKRGSIRVNKTPPSLNGSEVSIFMSLDIPNKIFEKPTLQASISIPEEAVTKSPINADVADNVAEVLEQATGLKFSITVEEQPERDLDEDDNFMP